MRKNFNNLKLVAYSSGTTEVISSGLDKAQGLNFRTCYPGGIFADMIFFVPMNVIETLTSWQVRVNQRIQALNSLAVVWEGKIITITPSFANGEEGAIVTCYGYWAEALMARYLRKPWADTRYSEDVWYLETGGALNDKFDYQREGTGGLVILPKAEDFLTNEYGLFRYVSPTGQTIKRVTFNYAFLETGQNWQGRLRDTTNLTNLWTVTADGTGSQDITLGTPSSNIAFVLDSLASQTPLSDGSQSLKITALTVYTETGAINLTEIAKDVRAVATELSADETQIASNTLSLVPFIADPFETLADILTRAASFGDSSFNAWACCVRASTLASDDKPILCVEQQPALTDCEYVIRLDDPNIAPGFSFEQDISQIVNDVIVGYTDAEGVQRWITSADDANLTDTTSVAAYGTRQVVLTLNTESSTTAANFGRRYLAQRKDPQWRASGDLVINGYIRGKTGNTTPACEIQAGQRVRVDNWLNDLSGTGLTFLITATRYEDSTEQCSLSLGRPDNLDVYLTRLGRDIG